MATIVMTVFGLGMLGAILSDIRSMTIPNWLCLSLVAAFAVSALLAGLAPAAIGVHLITGLVVLLITIGLFSLGWMGGGDAKLIAATALWFGPSVDLANYVLLASVLGGVLTLLLVTARAIRRPTTGLVFVDRLLSPASGIPYGVALGSAGIAVFFQSGWMSTLS